MTTSKRAALESSTRSSCSRVASGGGRYPGASEAEITLSLQRWQAGDRDREDELWSFLYRELEVVASSLLRDAGAGSLLEARELLHEACIRLLRRSDLSWASPGHFLAFATEAMRHVLADRSRRRRAARRRAEITGPPPKAIADPSAEHAFRALDFDLLLARLTEVNPRSSRLVELRFVAGLSVEEAARALEISKATAVREWQTARSWLCEQLQVGEGEA
ncbi:MAG: sigma-70 family RNA polymerase sigma factor [Acidobacteria bacterium]|nr:sigma-70 family RNA polymerase sigma factor [Acidobacteriota bacterium]